MTNSESSTGSPWWLRSESIVVLLLAAIAFLVGFGQFKQHASDFEEQAKESFARIEAQLNTYALKSEVIRLESRVEALEDRERDTNSILIRLETQVKNLDDHIVEFQRINDLFEQFIDSNRASRYPPQ